MLRHNQMNYQALKAAIHRTHSHVLTPIHRSKPPGRHPEQSPPTPLMTSAHTLMTSQLGGGVGGGQGHIDSAAHLVSDPARRYERPDRAAHRQVGHQALPLLACRARRERLSE